MTDYLPLKKQTGMKNVSNASTFFLIYNYRQADISWDTDVNFTKILIRVSI